MVWEFFFKLFSLFEIGIYVEFYLLFASLFHLICRSSSILSPKESIIFFLKKIVLCERLMLFSFFFYALIMYAHVYTLHDVLLLCNTTNLRILSSLGGDSEKRGFRICDYSKRNIKQHPDFGRKLNKTGNKPKFKKKIVPVIASCSENRSTLWNLWTLLLLNVYIWWTRQRSRTEFWGHRGNSFFTGASEP